jgi:hypothetical protein
MLSLRFFGGVRTLILAPPAVVGGRLILRTQEELVCVGAKK